MSGVTIKHELGASVIYCNINSISYVISQINGLLVVGVSFSVLITIFSKDGQIKIDSIFHIFDAFFQRCCSLPYALVSILVAVGIVIVALVLSSRNSWAGTTLWLKNNCTSRTSAFALNLDLAQDS